MKSFVYTYLVLPGLNSHKSYCTLINHVNKLLHQDRPVFIKEKTEI